MEQAPSRYRKHQHKCVHRLSVRFTKVYRVPLTEQRKIQKHFYWVSTTCVFKDDPCAGLRVFVVYVDCGLIHFFGYHYFDFLLHAVTDHR